jgi:hypothetical protein
MTFFRKVQTLTLVLLLLCSVCITTVMAGTKTKVTEDGVHFLKFDDSPTELDPLFYHMHPTEDVVVDGNQFYWVRIGNVKADGLTSVWWSLWLSIAIFSLFCGFFAWYWTHGIHRFFPNALPKTVTDIRSNLKIRTKYSIPLICVGLLLYFSMVSGILPTALTHAACGDFVDLKASDGTILLSVDKLHPETNTLYMKSGRNITNLYHIPCSGNSIQNYGVSPP